MRRFEIIILSLAGVVTLFVLTFSLVPTARSRYARTPENYARAKAAEVENDPCATPPGYTDAEWQEHLGHHPDQYSDCLK